MAGYCIEHLVCPYMHFIHISHLATARMHFVGSEYEQGGLKIDLFKVLSSTGSSLFSLILYGTLLFLAARENGLSIVEYLWFGLFSCSSLFENQSFFFFLIFSVVLNGSFNFCPYLPAIERGREKGDAVNWVSYKFRFNFAFILMIHILCISWSFM